MAKIKTECACGGSYDGTPSGKSKHIATSKHVGWEVGQRAAARSALAKASPFDVRDAAKSTGMSADELATDEGVQAVASLLPVKAVVSGTPFEAIVNPVIQDLNTLIGEKEQELARRQIDHAYRVRHSTAEAALAYFSSKVDPLKIEIGILRSARSLIGGES